MDRCKYIVTHTSWMVEMPNNGRQYHQMIASLWISHLVLNLPLTPMMVVPIASAQFTNPRQIAAQPCINFSFSARFKKGPWICHYNFIKS